MVRAVSKLPLSPRDRIRDRALSLGFDAVGFCEARLGPEARERLAAFVAAGQHGDMWWLATRTEQRAQPTALWPEARAVIALALTYAPEGDPLAPLAMPERGTISAYARGRDYHDLMKGKLKHLAAFVASRFGAGVKVFADTAPVMEKPLGEAAGLGWVGKHTNLVSRAHGSWLFLGEIYTTLDIPPDPPHANHCGTCDRCQAVCPTNAFPAPYRLDATRCVSYLTIEHKGPIPHALRPLMGNRIYGCDDCLAVCPWNRFARPTTHAALLPRQELLAPRLAELAALDDAAFRTLFAGSPIKRIGRDRFVRNVLNAIGNSGDPALRSAAERLTGDPDPVVAEAARWAVARLGQADTSNVIDRPGRPIGDDPHGSADGPVEPDHDDWRRADQARRGSL
jgi:epoxyqueuosine reductase